MPTGPQLFIELMLRLKNFPEAAVLWLLLKEHADIREFKVSTGSIALELLPGVTNQREVHRAIVRLKKQGLIQARIHANYRTLVTVDRTAVLALLREPVADRLPGRNQKHFPFLDAWRDDALRVTCADGSPAEPPIATAPMSAPASI